jgi:membrane-associated protease RseP (regulator of RpoE activity)
MYLLLFLIPIVLIHELSHAIAAKWCKCRVEVLSLGFGKVVWEKKYKGTIYRVCWVLLGGYCQLYHELTVSRSKYAFTNLRYSQKVLISLAGIFVNVLTGIISTWLSLYFGNEALYYFGIYSIALGLTNLLPFPALDGSMIFAFLFEKWLGKKKLYPILVSLFSKWFYWLMVFNILSLPYLVYLIYTGQVK